MGNILVLDDEQGMREMLQMMLEEEGYNVTTVPGIAEATAAVKQNVYDLIISDLRLEDGNAIDFLSTVKEISPFSSVIIITAYATLESALKAIRIGAYDYILKPFKIDMLRNTVRNAFQKKTLVEENLYLRELADRANIYDNIVAESRVIRDLIGLSYKAAQSDANIMITGESGVGKEMFARFIHKNSRRKEEPFIAINCGALPENLLESELFGYVTGAFTGANKNKEGLFVVANKGTIFLDEISETTNNFQVKLLRVIQEQEIRPVGSSSVKKIDVRIIAASNKDMGSMVGEGSFRKDLFYRINVIPVQIPPLRERREDIPLLADHFLRQYGNNRKRLAPDALEMLLRYDFPGNVRELQNIIERVCVLTQGSLITKEDLHFLEPSREEGYGETALIPLKEVEKRHLLRVLRACEGNKSRAAEILGVSRKFIYSKINEYQLDENEA
ncbi:MAG TPA: sigma-54 dependent transcriptional regulator [Candidatus Mcinerneyibacteriales bacterium]|nr:sigma-54 dependent transcriptional regulator [Candidatus Mcinerneyibacteriales bacterium]